MLRRFPLASGSRRNARPRVLPRLAILLFLLVTVLPKEAFGQEVRENGEPTRVLTPFLAPPSTLLSGISAAAVEGLDPRWVKNLPPGVTFPELNASVQAAAAGSTTSAATGSNQQVPFRNPAPAFSRNVMISRALGNYPVSTEPHIAVDPTDPDHLVMGAIDFNLPSVAIYVSFDGGETWQGPKQPRYFREDYAVGGDPVIAFDRQGNVYVTLLSIGFEEFQIGTILSATTVSSLVISKSTDGGLTWGDGVPAARSRVTTVSNVDSEGKERGIITSGFLDKEWMAIGPSTTDPSKDVIYISYTDFEYSSTVLYSDELPYLTPIATETTIRVVASEDGGLTWTQPVPASPTARYAETYAAGGGEGGSAGFAMLERPDVVPAPSQDGDDGTSQTDPATSSALRPQRYVQGSQPQVMSNGTLIVAWYDSTDDGPGQGIQTEKVAISSDDARSFGDPIQAAYGREWHSPTRTLPLRIDGSKFPQMKVGPNDEIYIVYGAQPIDKPKDDGDVYLVSSFDKGMTWTNPVRVNQDDKGTLQFLPNVAVQPDGTVGVMWGDSRDDPQEIRFHVYFTKSEDQGKTFGFSVPEQGYTAPDTRVTDFPSNSNRVCPRCVPEVGDYWAMTANEKDFYLVWGDTRLAEFGGFNTQIAFARTQAIPNPSLFLNPPSGTAGRIVDIVGTGFQPLSNIQLLVSGVVVSNPRTGEDGTFTTSIYMPLTGEGPTSISAFDETGNAATASFYTEFGFDSLQKSLDEINSRLNQTPAAGSENGTTATPTPSSGTGTQVAPPFGTASGSPIASPPGTPSGSPVALPFGTTSASPVALPFGTPVTSGSITTSSGEPPLTVSSGIAPTRFALAAAIGLVIVAGFSWWRRHSRSQSLRSMFR